METDYSQEYQCGREAAKNDIYQRKTFPPYRTKDWIAGYQDYWKTGHWTGRK